MGSICRITTFHRSFWFLQDAQLEETLAEEDVCDLQKSSLRRRLAGEDECKDETTGRRQALAGGDQCKSEPAEQHIESTEKCKVRNLHAKLTGKKQ